MSGIDNAGEGITNQKQFIEYTAFNKVSHITQGINEQNINRVYNIFYGLDEQRIKTMYDDFSISGHIKTRYYFGSYEKDIDEFGNVTETDYLYTPVGLTAMQRKTSAGANLYYIHTDLLGSIERITNATGQIISEYTYTPWGGRILLSGVNITDRGYTGHEHLSPFGDDSNGGFCLINMNGRIYDPVLARFLSPDPYVQAPDFTQSFNRYSYVWNNPFRFTDPSGELIITSILIGAAIGGTINLISQIASGNVRNGWDALGAFGIGAVVGGLSGGAGAWAAGAVKAAGIITGAAVGAVSGAVIGGASSFLLNGGNNLLNGNGFLHNWQNSVKSGMLMGAITGGIAGGISGYTEALKQGKNMWWGSKITHGNGKWSFFNAEKPYETVEWDIKRVGNKLQNDCLPTTYSELDSPAFGDTYEYNIKKTGYIENVGTMTSKANIIKHITAEYGASDFSMLNLNDPELMSKILSQGDRIAIHAKKGLVNIDHADVIRKIEYFKSGKVKVSLRIGTFDLKTLYSNDIIYFRVPNSFQIQQHFLNSQQQLKNSFYHFK